MKELYYSGSVEAAAYLFWLLLILCGRYELGYNQNYVFP